jgi:FtsH-binding integral membrane protein
MRPDASFVLRVYAVLLGQLSCTTLVVWAMVHFQSVQRVCLQHLHWWMPVCAMVGLVCLLGLYIHHWNAFARLCCFVGFTLSCSLLLGGIGCDLVAGGHEWLMLRALSVTMLVIVCLTLFVALAMDDVSATHLWFQQLVLGCVLVLVLVVYTVPLWPLSLFARAVCGVMVFIAYLIVDTYRLVHDSTMHGGDPLLCAMELYVDVVNAFVFVVDALIHDSTE